MNYDEVVSVVRDIWADDYADCKIQYDKSNNRMYAVCDTINQRRLLDSDNLRDILLDMLSDYNMEKFVH